jgi:hypothetical protein
MSSHNSDETGEGKVKAILILDIVGRPPEHLVDTLKKLAEEMGKEKGVTVISKQIKEPALIKDQKDFYTTFAEIEIEVEEILGLALLMFKYMPAHIEILSPEILALSNNSFNDILNELVRRLHGYDEIARIIQIEHHKLISRIKELEGNPGRKESKGKVKKRGKKKQAKK